jgi:hypothetical protein
MARRVLEHITATDWDSGKPGSSGFGRVRYLQQVDDVINRPLLNRVTASGNAAVNTNGATQSTAVGTGTIQPKRFAELTAKCRVTFNLSGNGTLYVFLYRTLGAIPANGAAPGGADVPVSGDAFTGGSVSTGVNQCAAFSFLDTGLDPTKQYRFYLAVKGTNALVANLVNSSVIVMERS